ncbi:MAG TPA: NusA-like transcription termination signal-binding factor [Methanomassiliicoccales archaeon]|nr:NusA-like transcription termination signal-binding factor [Methanomassiliicoccales archaeon]HXZ24350.1 NusA-like transcription termination signal-binding factor [Methanomassiliicoccales archaeon]
MPEATLTEDSLRYITLFENITKTHVRDCMETEDKLVFVVDPGQANRAVGKAGEHVIRMKNTTGKNIQVVEYSDDPETFIKNVFYNYSVQSVVLENRGTIVHATVTVDPKVKGRAIGKNGRNLKIARDLVSRHHNVQSIVVA